MRILATVCLIALLGCFDAEFDCLKDPFPACESEEDDIRCPCVGPAQEVLYPEEPEEAPPID